jgi:hypothetical protein
LCLLLLLEEYEVTFEYLLRKKYVAAVVDNLSRLDTVSLKIQEEAQEALTLLSEPKKNYIIDIKVSMQMYTTLIFKEKAIV